MGKLTYGPVLKPEGMDRVMNDLTDEEFEAAFKRAMSHDGPYLIDAVINMDEFVLPMLPPGGSIDDMITSVEEANK